jgi:chromosome segregation ATPase
LSRDVEPLLTLAADLEARDERVASDLARVEQSQADVDEIRVRAAAVEAFLASLPAALAGHARAEETAESDRAAAQAALAAAAEDELGAERARARIADAEARAERAREHQEALEREGIERRDEGRRLCERVGVDDLAAVLAWASHRRGELLVEHSGLARRREEIVREASELLGSVLGDPHAATSVAGLRERLRRALP